MYDNIANIAKIERFIITTSNIDRLFEMRRLIKSFV